MCAYYLDASVSAKIIFYILGVQPKKYASHSVRYCRKIFRRCARYFSPLENTQPERDPAILSGVRQVPALCDGCQIGRLIRAHADAQMATTCESQHVSQRQWRAGRSLIDISGWGRAGRVYSLFSESHLVTRQSLESGLQPPPPDEKPQMSGRLQNLLAQVVF